MPLEDEDTCTSFSDRIILTPNLREDPVTWMWCKVPCFPHGCIITSFLSWGLFRESLEFTERMHFSLWSNKTKLLFSFWSKVSCSPGWPQCYYIAEPTHELCVHVCEKWTCTAVAFMGRSEVNLGCWWMPSILLGQNLDSLWAVACATLAGLWVSQACPLSTSHCCRSAGITDMPAGPGFLWVLGLKLRSLYFGCKHLTHWAISPVPQPWTFNSPASTSPMLGL